MLNNNQIYYIMFNVLLLLYFQSNMIPERGTIYDFCFEKKGSGNWIEWMDTLDRSLLTVPKDAKVSLLNRRI